MLAETKLLSLKNLGRYVLHLVLQQQQFLKLEIDFFLF